MGRFGNVLLVSGETDLSLAAQLGRGRAPLPDQHRQHPGLQGRAAGGADEARRRRQRPRRARAVRRRRGPRAVRAGGGRRALRPGRRAHAGAPHAGARSTRWPRSTSARSGRAGAGGAVRGPAHATPTWRPSASGSRRTWSAEPDKTLAFIAEMDMGAPEGDGPVVYTCPMHPEVVSEEPGHCPRVRDEAAASRPGTTYTCPMHPRSSARAGPLPECGMKLLPRSSCSRRHGTSTSTTATTTPRRTASSGKTTWSRSTG